MTEGKNDSNIAGEGFTETAKLHKLCSIGNGKLLHNVKQRNDILHFHTGLYLREITGCTVEDRLEGGKFRSKW